MSSAIILILQTKKKISNQQGRIMKRRKTVLIISLNMCNLWLKPKAISELNGGSAPGELARNTSGSNWVRTLSLSD